MFFQNRSLLYIHSRCARIEIHHQPQPDWCICSSSLCRGCSAPQSFKSHLGFSGRWNSFLRAQWSIDPAIQSTGQSCLNELFTNHHRKLGEMAVRLQSQMETAQNKRGKVGVGTKRQQFWVNIWWRGADEKLITVYAGILWTGCWTHVVLSTCRFRDLREQKQVTGLKTLSFYCEYCHPTCSEHTSEGGAQGGGRGLTNPPDLQHVNTRTTCSPLRHHLLWRPSSRSP